MDTALILEAIAGYDPAEPNSADYPVERYAAAIRARTGAWKIGVVRRPFFEQLDPEIEEAVNKALMAIAKLTAGTREVQLPSYQTLPIVGAEAYAFHQPYFSKTPELYQPATRQRIASGAGVTTAAYIEARRELDRLRRSVGAAFSAVDLLVSPSTPVLQGAIEQDAALETIPPGGVTGSLRNTQPFDIFGLPAISIPCGFTRDGLPIGLQIAGPRFGESRVLALAHAYQQATDWHTRRPPL